MNLILVDYSKKKQQRECCMSHLIWDQIYYLEGVVDSVHIQEQDIKINEEQNKEAT